MSEVTTGTEDYVQMDAVDWAPFPEALCIGAIRLEAAPCVAGVGRVDGNL